MSIRSFATLLMIGFVAASTFATDGQDRAFKEDLRFGAEEDDPEYFWLDEQISCDFQVTANGHIFVVDQRNAQIFEFDPEGTFVREVARKGDGPGEYQAVANLSLNPDGSGIGIDFRNGTLKAHYYGPGMTFQKTEFMKTMGFMFRGGFNREVGYMQMITFGETPAMKINMINKDLEPASVVREVPWPQNLGPRGGEQAAWVDYMAGQFKGFFEIANSGVGFAQDGRVIVGDGNKGEYQVWNEDYTKKLKTIKVPLQPILFGEKQENELVESITTILFKQMGPSAKNLITDRTLEKAIEKANLPNATNHVHGVVGIKDNLFASVVDANFATGEVTLEVIDIDKGSKGRFTLPDKGIFTVFGTRLHFMGDHAYAMVWNEDGDNQIVRYKYDMNRIK